jgi:AcrR family transcriptional regulator
VSPRPRTIDDADILAACQRVMQRVGPAKFTLALVAGEAGVSAATLIQRFGSKRKLLRAMSGGMDGYSSAMVGELRAALGSPLEVLRGFLLCYADMARTPREMAHHLAYLQLDLTDPVLHRNLLAMSRENEHQLVTLLTEAVAQGELAPLDAARIARLLNGMVAGSLLSWATFREGAARDWLSRDIETVLAPYRPREPGRPRIRQAAPPRLARK